MIFAPSRANSQRPKLLFLIFDHSGSARRVSPYASAGLQAEGDGCPGIRRSRAICIPFATAAERIFLLQFPTLGMDSREIRPQSERHVLRHVPRSQLRCARLPLCRRPIDPTRRTRRTLVAL